MKQLQKITQAYNRLPDLVDADTMLKSVKTKNAIELLLAVIAKHKLSHLVGLRLLHKHNDLFEKEVMAEDYLVDSKGFALVTRARHGDELGENYVPNSWMLEGSSFIPMELSDRGLVSDPRVNPESFADFFAELAETLRLTGVEGVVGPSLLGSGFIDSHRPAGSEMMLEATALDDRANVLRFILPGETVEGDGIETHWCINLANNAASMNTKKCTKICPSVQNPPVHQGTYIHQQS